MEQDAFFWPRVVAVIRAGHHLPPGLDHFLAGHGIDCRRLDRQSLLVDISYLQRPGQTTGAIIASLQHVLNLELSPFDYALGIGSEPVAAWHVASTLGLGQERWLMPWQFQEQIDSIPVTALQVIDPRMPAFFQSCYKRSCGELRDFGRKFLQQRFGYAGDVLWSLLRGKSRQLPDQKQLSNGDLSWQLSLPARTRSQRALLAHAWRLYSTVRRNLVSLDRQAREMELSYRTDRPGSGPPAIRLDAGLNHRRELDPYLDLLELDRDGVSHLGINVSGLFHPAGQLELF